MKKLLKAQKIGTFDPTKVSIWNAPQSYYPASDRQNAPSRQLSVEEIAKQKAAAEEAMRLKKLYEQQELARRKQAIAASIEARDKELTAENFATETGAIGEKLRFFPNDPNSFIDEYINPFKMVGDMASGLGQIPLNLQQGNYGQAALNLAVPVATGLLGGVGAKTTGQFVNNLVNPFAGMGIGKRFPHITNSKLGSSSLLNVLEKTFANYNPKNLQARPALQWMKDWYEHPDFVRRYNNTGFYRPRVMQQGVLDALDLYTPKNYIDLLKDRGLLNYLKYSLNTGGLSYGVPDAIYHNRMAYAPFNRKALESVKAHELTHLIERNGRLLSYEDINSLLKPFGYDNEKIFGQNLPPDKLLGKTKAYYLKPSEIHARMNQARFDLNLSPEDEFTEEMFDKISKDNNWYDMGKYIKDKKGFIDLMNNFWAVPPAVIIGTEALQEQKNGGMIKRKDGSYSRRGLWDTKSDWEIIG